MQVPRAAERALVDGMLSTAAGGQSEVVLIEGDPGIGKTAVVQYAASRAAGWRLLSAHGAPSETRLPFAGLGDLVRPVADRVDELPPAQAHALRAALAVESGRSVDRFAVAAGTLSLVSAVADEGPLLVLVDDLHWLDAESSEAVTFTARRLNSEPLAFLLTARPDELDHERVAHLQMHVHAMTGLRGQEVDELLADAAGVAVAPDVAAALATHTGGNPLALLELARALGPEVLAGREPLGEIPAASVEEQYRKRIQILPRASRRALLAHAMLDLSRPDARSGAIARCIDGAALQPAIDAGLLEADLAFRHPLARAATINGASVPERQAAHLSIAAALEDESDEDERALHLAAAASHPDETLAKALEAAAERAHRRAGYAASARILERSAGLSPARADRARRLMRAGRDAGLAGHDARARTLLDEAVAVSTTTVERADIESLRGRLRAAYDPPLEAHAALIDEAERLQDHDPAHAGEMFLIAAWACMNKGREALGVDAGRRARDLLSQAGSPLVAPAAAMVEGFLVCAGELGSADRLIAASDALRDRPVEGIAGIEWDSRTAHPLIWIEEYDRARFLLDRSIAAARKLSALSPLPFALARRAELALRIGAWGTAYGDASEAVQLAEATRQHVVAFCLSTLALVAAGRGDQICHEHVAAARRATQRSGTGSVDAYCRAAEGLLALGAGDNEATIEALAPLPSMASESGLQEPGVIQWAPDLIEAYVRGNRHAQAHVLLDTFRQHAVSSGRRWALAATARCEALLAGDAFDGAFSHAVGLHEGTTAPLELARCELDWGERLRRARRRGAARGHLRRAASIFDDLGAAAFTQRARSELELAGGRAAPAPRSGLDTLTAQEMQIALHVARGATNREVATALFLSVKTIEAHLRSTYRKLGIRSRAQLAVRVASTRDATLSD